MKRILHLIVTADAPDSVADLLVANFGDQAAQQVAALLSATWPMVAWEVQRGPLPGEAQ